MITSDTSREDTRLDAKQSSPFTQSEGSPFKGHKMIVSFIISLNHFCSPSTILRRIISVIINSVNFIISWAVPHIKIKILKCLPPITHLNASTAIIIIAKRIRIIASFFDTSPDFIHSFLGHSMCAACLQSFFIKTATTFSVTIGQVARSYLKYIPAITTTNPRGVRFFSMNWFESTKESQNSKSTKFLPGQIFKIIRTKNGWRIKSIIHSLRNLKTWPLGQKHSISVALNGPPTATSLSARGIIPVLPQSMHVWGHPSMEVV